MGALTKLTEKFTETAIDGEIVIMRLENGEFFGLSGTAAATWQLIDGIRDRAALLEALAAQFSTPEEQITRDVDDFLARLMASGLLVVA